MTTRQDKMTYYRHIIMVAVAIMITPVISSAQTENETPQVQWVGDLPINPNLTIEPGLGFAFDSPEGRVVMILLSGDVDSNSMQEYYRQALPPLGWEQTGDMRWAREGEALLINKTEAAGAALWKLTLRPE